MAFSRTDRFRSAAIGARSWSRSRVLVFTRNPCVPSKSTRAVTLPPGFSLRCAPNEAMTRSGYFFRASDSASRGLVVHHFQNLFFERSQSGVIPAPYTSWFHGTLKIIQRVLLGCETSFPLRSIQCWQSRHPLAGPGHPENSHQARLLDPQRVGAKYAGIDNQSGRSPLQMKSRLSSDAVELLLETRAAQSRSVP